MFISEMSVVICCPHNSASETIGSHALANQYNILVYMPTETDKKFGQPIFNDLGILAERSGENSVGKITTPDFSLPDTKVVFFPNLGKYYKFFNKNQ